MGEHDRSRTKAGQDLGNMIPGRTCPLARDLRQVNLWGHDPRQKGKKRDVGSGCQAGQDLGFKNLGRTSPLDREPRQVYRWVQDLRQKE
jgi:hypothetical protein